jgi:hypothetical protein
VVEMNTGQMVEDVLRVTPHHDRVRFYGRPCAIPTPEGILGEIRKAVGRNPDVTGEGHLRRAVGRDPGVTDEGHLRKAVGRNPDVTGGEHPRKPGGRP